MPDAGQFGKDRRAARPGMLVGLEHGHAGAFADHQAVAVGGKGAAGVARQRPQRLPALQHAIDQRRVGAAGEHDVGAAEPKLVGGGRQA